MTRTRIASWVLLAVALVLTVAAIFKGVEMVSALTGILMVVWGAALGLVGFAYKDLVMASKDGSDAP